MSYNRRYTTYNMNSIWAIIGINFLVFIAVRVNPPLLYLLALNPYTFSETPWTIISNIFTHYQIWHIFANMMTLYFFGGHLLRLVGQKSFLIVYLLGGIIGSVFFLFILPPGAAIGASGAVFAVGGALAILMPRLKVIIFPIPFPLPLGVAVLLIFVIFSFLPNIAWQAHLGGLVTGLIAGYLFRRRERR